jgi:tetratricopeptide (TPR) repeat protein
VLRRLAVLATLAGLLLFEAPPAAAQAPASGARQVDARAGLDQAARLRRGLSGLRGDARARHLQRVVGAYRDLRTRFGDQPHVVAEASFRAGELLRAAGDAAAREEFERAWRRGLGSDWRARAGLELGHLARRAQDDSRALACYRRVLTDTSSAPSRRDEAALWAGRCCVELGREDEARDLWERVATQAMDPCDRVAAHDELALLWIAAGDLEAAAGELERARAGVRERALERTPLGARVRSALRRMRAVTRLRARVAARREGVVVER